MAGVGFLSISVLIFVHIYVTNCMLPDVSFRNKSQSYVEDFLRNFANQNDNDTEQFSSNIEPIYVVHNTPIEKMSITSLNTPNITNTVPENTTVTVESSSVAIQTMTTLDHTSTSTVQKGNTTVLEKSYTSQNTPHTVGTQSTHTPTGTRTVPDEPGTKIAPKKSKSAPNSILVISPSLRSTATVMTFCAFLGSVLYFTACIFF